MDDDDCDCCCSKDIADRCFVIAVVALIAFCYVSYWYLIVIPWQWVTSPTLVGIVNVVGLNVSFGLLCYSYYKTMFTSPGVVDRWEPPNATPEVLEALKEEEKDRAKEENISNFYLPRWCKSCENWKPPRSHHSSDASACILKLDHYCPWVYNAVGYRNHKFFILFLFYSSLSLTYFLICCVTRVFYVFTYRHQIRTRNLFTVPEVILLVIQLVLTLPVTIGIISLFCYQISCLVSNCTNVETYIYKRYRRIAKKYSIDFTWFYDHGMYYNICEVMGPNIWSWFIPTLPEHIRNGTGIVWKTKQFEKTKMDNTIKEAATGVHKRLAKQKDSDD